MIGCCFEVEGKTNYGIVEGDRVIQDSGRPLGENAVTNNIHSLEQVKYWRHQTSHAVLREPQCRRSAIMGHFC